MKKLNRNNIAKRVTARPFKKRLSADERARQAFGNVPNITNETVAKHREDIIGGARKYIYPLKHSRRRAVIISSSIFITALVLFMSYTAVSLYKLQSTSGFIYGITKVIPFPVAKAGDSWVSYNSYLFELRHYMHYYTTQQDADFNGKDKGQLDEYKKQAMQDVINDAYVKQLAKKNDVRVTTADVDRQVQLVRSQNRLGSSERQFNEVLNEFWGWDENDFKRSLQQEMLAQAVVAKLDTATNKQAQDTLTQLKGGADFATLASQVSQDAATKSNGGQYPQPIDKNDGSISAIVAAELAKLQPGQYSGVINTGYSLEIVKVNAITDGKIQASHITFNYKSINDYITPLKKDNPSSEYIKF
jgi:parvulin-like peptidyl-prolyl isomerase